MEPGARAHRPENATCAAGTMLKRWSRNGWFLGCEKYPKCKNTRDLGADGLPTQPKETGIACDKCGKGMVVKSGRYGEFLSCTGYPECKNAKPVPLGVKCPKCGGDIIEIRSKKQRRALVLRLFQLCDRVDQMRLQALAEAPCRALSELRCPLPHHGRHPRQAGHRVREQGVRLQTRRRRSAAVRWARRWRFDRGGRVLHRRVVTSARGLR